MKKAIVLFVVLFLIPSIGFTQFVDNLDFVSPMHEGLAAVKKDNQWAFVNMKGNIVVDFRDDLVSSKTNDGNYPIFKDGRCMIVKMVDGISYFGFVDSTGKTIIKPQFLNALNFSNGKALVLKLEKEVVGNNTALGKNIVYYKYYEVTIDTMGDVEYYLTQEGHNVVIDKDFLEEPPKITSKLLSDSLVAILDKNGKWLVKNLK